jgi:regulator of protease activity HflC (stomatin/prohibitin superfamily)
MNDILVEDILMPYLTFGMLAALFIVIIYNTIKILKEYERGVIFLLGRFQTVKGPGLIILFPGVQKMTKIDLRVIVMDVPTQDVISRDNVSVKVNAVIYFRIVDPEKAVIRVADVFEATSQLSQTTLRSVLGQHELDDMLSERDKLNTDIQGLLDQRTDNWGIKVSNVEIKHVDLDESMIRAIAQQAEAERARRAKIINAEAEKQAATMLSEAAHILAGEEQALQLRYLQTLKEISNERTNTIVFPMPLEFVEPILSVTRKNSKS